MSNFNYYVGLLDVGPYRIERISLVLCETAIQRSKCKVRTATVQTRDDTTVENDCEKASAIAEQSE